MKENIDNLVPIRLTPVPPVCEAKHILELMGCGTLDSDFRERKSPLAPETEVGKLGQG